MSEKPWTVTYGRGAAIKRRGFPTLEAAKKAVIKDLRELQIRAEKFDKAALPSIIDGIDAVSALTGADSVAVRVDAHYETDMHISFNQAEAA